MTRALFPASLLLLVACAAEPDEPVDSDTDGLIAGCADEDDDGFEDVACGGLDCDDTDADVHPSAFERLDDLVDQDCDGNPDLGLLYVLAVEGYLGGPWTFSPDGGAFGGLEIHQDRAAEAITVPLSVDDEPARTTVTPQTIPLILTAPAVRLWSDKDALDVYVVAGASEGHQIRALDGTTERVLQEEPGEGPEWFSASVVGDDLHMVECGDHPLTWLQTPVVGGTVIQVDQDEVGPDRCAVLGTGEVPTLLAGTAAPGPLTRWRVIDDALAEPLVLAPTPSLERLSTVAEDGRALFAFADGQRIRLFDASGNGSIEEAGGTVEHLAVDVAETGEVALAWSTDDGAVHVAYGELGRPLETLTTEGVDAQSQVAVSLTADRLQVAWVVNESWQIHQALR